MQTYTIRDLSLKYGLPTSTLRYYEEIGLLNNVCRTKQGARIYTQKHISKLDGILCFKRAGLPIAKILEFYQYEADITAHTDDIISMLTSHKEDIQKQISELNNVLEHIQEKILYYTKVKEALETGAEIPTWDTIIGNK